MLLLPSRCRSTRCRLKSCSRRDTCSAGPSPFRGQSLSGAGSGRGRRRGFRGRS